MQLRRETPRVAAPAPAKRCRTAYQAFVQQHRAEGPLDVLRGRWALLSQEDKAAYLENEVGDEVAAAVAAAAPAVELTTPWPHIADDTYPMSVEAIADLPARVKPHSQAWATRIGAGAIAPEVHITALPQATCGERYGVGFCGLNIGDGDAAELASFKTRFNIWAAATKEGDARFDMSWGKLPLFYAGPQGAVPAGAAEDTRGLLALLIYPEGSPRRQLFYVDKIHPPLAGETVGYNDLAIGNLTIEADFARTVPCLVRVFASRVTRPRRKLI